MSFVNNPGRLLQRPYKSMDTLFHEQLLNQCERFRQSGSFLFGYQRKGGNLYSFCTLSPHPVHSGVACIHAPQKKTVTSGQKLEGEIYVGLVLSNFPVQVHCGVACIHAPKQNGISSFSQFFKIPIKFHFNILKKTLFFGYIHVQSHALQIVFGGWAPFDGSWKLRETKYVLLVSGWEVKLIN